MSLPSREPAAVPEHATQLSTVLRSSADALSRLDESGWQAQSLCSEWTVRDVAGHMVWRIGSSTIDMLRSGAEAWLGHHTNPMHIIDELSQATAEASPEELVGDLYEIADERERGLGRNGLSEVAEAVVHSFDMMQPLGINLGIDAEVTHAVARSRLPLLSFSARRVLMERSLVATDAGWSIGSGEPIRGTAEAIVLYLYGRKPIRHA